MNEESPITLSIMPWLVAAFLLVAVVFAMRSAMGL